MGFLRRVAERFWFLPGGMCLAAVVLSESLITVDAHLDEPVGSSWTSALFYRIGESGTRDILGTIAAASLGVAGTTFSITMAVLALTSSSYGPRLVRNFMADRANQAVLGTFVATFLYSLLVLRSVGSPGGGSGSDTAFVPHLAVNTAIVLALANVAAMIYFIHHISDSIQIATLSSGVRAELLEVVDRMYPSDVGEPAERPNTQPPPDVPHGGLLVRAGQPGYVQMIQADDLLRLTTAQDLVGVVLIRPGAFVLDDSPVIALHPADRVDPDLARRVQGAFEISNARNPHQDIDFAVQQLTEMAVRALSPGTNDPNTAVNALDDLSAGLAKLASREVPVAARVDDEGTVRLHLPVEDPVRLITGVLDQMRWYAASSPSVMHATLRFIETVGSRASSATLGAELSQHLVLVREAFAQAGHHPHDIRAFDRHAAEVAGSLAPA